MAGSSNFLAWNPPQNNQETDSQYNADSLRTGGATSGAIAPSPLLNKLFHQVSILAAAITQALAGKGYACSDADQNALASVFANLVTQADLRAQTIQVTYSSTPIFDASLATAFEMTLSGPVTSSQLINVRPGDIITFQITQNGVGGYPFQYASPIINPSTIETAPGTVNIQSFRAQADRTLRAFTPLMTYP